MQINYRKLSKEQLFAIKTGKDHLAAAQAGHELDLRIDRARFWRNFFFPNLWSVLSLVVAIYAASKK